MYNPDVIGFCFQLKKLLFCNVSCIELFTRKILMFIVEIFLLVLV